MAKTIKIQTTRKAPVKKRTSIGRNATPKNKHARWSRKAYRGQGRGR